MLLKKYSLSCHTKCRLVCLSLSLRQIWRNNITLVLHSLTKAILLIEDSLKQKITVEVILMMDLIIASKHILLHKKCINELELCYDYDVLLKLFNISF